MNTENQSYLIVDDFPPINDGHLLELESFPIGTEVMFQAAVVVPGKIEDFLPHGARLLLGDKTPLMAVLLQQFNTEILIGVELLLILERVQEVIHPGGGAVEAGLSIKFYLKIGY